MIVSFTTENDSCFYNAWSECILPKYESTIVNNDGNPQPDMLKGWYAEFGIIMELEKVGATYHYKHADFRSESDYAWFKLKWQ